MADPGEGPGGPAPPLIFRLKWGPKGQKNFFFFPPPPPPPYCIGHLIWPIAKRPIRERGYQDLGRDILSTLLTLIFWKLVQKNDKRSWDLPSLHNTRYFFYVSQESEGNLSARHAMTGAIEVRQAVKGNYSVYRVSSLCFSAVNSLGGPLWKLNDTIFVAILKT